MKENTNIVLKNQADNVGRFDAFVTQPPKVYYKDELVTLYNAECEKVLPLVADESVKLVVTSPPYNLGNAKKGSFYGGKGKGDKIEYDKYNDNLEEEEYRIWQHKILLELWRILKPDGAIFYNHKPRIKNKRFDDRRNLIPLPIRQEIIWNRGGMVNFSGGFFAPNTERIFVIAKPDWKPNKETLGWGEIWKIAPEQNTEHPAPFPLELAKRAINSATQGGDVVLDPFSGSGTTIRAAKLLGRTGIGIELSEDYCALTERLLNPESPLFDAAG